MFNLFCAERTWGHSRFFVQCLLSSKALPTAAQHGVSPQLCSHSKAWLGNFGSPVSGSDVRDGVSRGQSCVGAAGAMRGPRCPGVR